MSTTSIVVAGPSASLAMLKALATKTHTLASHTWATARAGIHTANSTLRAAANLTLATLGSHTGYDLATTLTKTAITSLWGALRWTVSRITRTCGAATRALYTAISAISPSAAKATEAFLERWIIEPVLNTGLAIDATVTAAGQQVWALAHTSLVRTTTVTTAQTAAGLIAVHMLSKGVLAAKIVQALPWTMDAIVWLTNPVTAVLAVAAAFSAAAGIAAARLLAARPRTRAESAAAIDLDAIAAALRVDISDDGSVIVHGIPTDLPELLARQLADTAAAAAVNRLTKVLAHRQPNRDDKRLINKIAKEAVRRAGNR